MFRGARMSSCAAQEPASGFMRINNVERITNLVGCYDQINFQLLKIALSLSDPEGKCFSSRYLTHFSKMSSGVFVALDPVPGVDHTTMRGRQSLNVSI
jgi:hypothetical protein